MSGNTVALFAEDADGPTGRLVTALAVLSSDLPVALVGGLAVTCRLQEPHRATQDVDLVFERSAAHPDVVEFLVARGDAVRGEAAHRLNVNGVKLEFIETEALPVDLEGIPDSPLMFVLSHRWALESAVEMEVGLVGSPKTSLAVATPASLVAMKLHALRERSRDEKRAGDVFDIARLLGTYNRDDEISDVFASAPVQLARLAADAASQLLVDDADRAVRWLRAYGDPRASALDAQAIRDAVVPLVHALVARASTSGAG